MIDEARTLELFGYTSDSLTHGSCKKVVTVCDECGKVRLSQYHQHSALCHRCAITLYGVRNPFYGKHHSDESRQKISAANSGEQNSQYGKHHSDEERLKLSIALKGRKLTDETKLKMSNSRKGEKNPLWRGGTSFDPYCQKFNEAFKESIRDKFGRICFLCPKTEAENGRKLSVHHVNYDKNCLCDDVKCEFVPLCMTCHMKTNTNRGYWENLIIEKLKDSSQLLDQFSNK